MAPRSVDRVGIGVCEFTERSVLGIAIFALTPFAVLFAVPLIRPMRGKTFLFTYLIPVIPVVALFDGIVSCLRTYSPRELAALVAAVDGGGYTWEIGKVRSWRSPIPITYLLGYPAGGRGRVSTSID